MTARTPLTPDDILFYDDVIYEDAGTINLYLGACDALKELFEIDTRAEDPDEVDQIDYYLDCSPRLDELRMWAVVIYRDDRRDRQYLMLSGGDLAAEEQEALLSAARKYIGEHGFNADETAEWMAEVSQRQQAQNL